MLQNDDLSVKYGRDLGLEVDDMCAQLSYFFVYPFYHKKLNKPEYASIPPLVLTYQGDDTEMQELMKDLKQKKSELKNKNYLTFTLSNGRFIDGEKSVGWLKKFLMKKRIDGLVLFARVNEKKQMKEYNLKNQITEEQEVYVDQCCIMDYKGAKEGSSEYEIYINFKIPHSKYVLTFGVDNNSTFKNLLELFYEEVKRVFKVQLNNNHIKKLKVINKKGKQIELQINTDQSIRDSDVLINNTSIDIELNQKIDFKLEITHPNKKIIIYKENSEEFIEECFEEIEFMTFKTIYEGKLEGKKNVIDGMRCLKVMDTLVKEYQNLSKLSAFFEGSKNDIIKIVGRVISQKMYFYKHVGSLVDNHQNFKVQEIIEPSNSLETKDSFRLRIRSEIKKRAGKAVDDHFKNEKNVQPIYVYTSEETHNYQRLQNGDKAEKSEPIYALVNRHLREKNLLQEKAGQISEDWRNLFTSSLIKQLQKVKDLDAQKKVYRGMNLEFKVQKGDVITFKSFTSTSASMQQAEAFIFRPQPKPPQPKPDNNDQNNKETVDEAKKQADEEKKRVEGAKSLLQMTIKSGKTIRNLSDFQNEEEILLLPFSQFVVTSKEEKIIKQQKVMYICLKQLDKKFSCSKYPETKANFILWVDDKLVEGKYLYNNIKKFYEPTLLIQLKSTQELTDWLNEQKNQKLLMDKTANFAFITNMTREGNGLAGIDGIVELQKYTKEREIPILMYIGDKKKAQQKLHANKHRIRNFKKIKIGNQYQQIQQFLKEKINIRFEINQQSQMENKCSAINPEKNGSGSNVSSVSNSSSKTQKKSKSLLQCEIM